MKLYSTVISERAKIQQGGNKFLTIHVQVGSQKNPSTILEASVQREEKKNKDIYTLFLAGTKTDKITIKKVKN